MTVVTAEAGFRRAIDVLLHESLPGPMTCGVVHPAIMLPADARTWPEEDLRRALVHELEHVRRGDWISQPRGRAGATWVVAACAMAGLLVTAMSPLTIVAASTSGVTLEATSGPRGDRAQSQPPQSAPAARLHFEVASVKRCDDGSVPVGGRGGGGSASPGRLTLNCQVVKGLIQAAYLLHGDLIARPEAVLSTPIEGGPDWITSERYTIDAKAAGDTSPAVMQGPMLQALLEDRFKLRIHHDTREIPVYALTIAKGGAKLKPFREGSCVLPVITFPLTPPAALGPGERRCALLGSLVGPNMVINAEGITIQDLSKLFLLTAAGRPVIDKTGLTGKFDIHLEYAPPEDSPLRQMAASGAGEPTAPLILEVIQEQLGLKLEPGKGPGDFLVIDHVERPTPDGAFAATAPPAQTAQKFDVASVKPCPDPDPAPASSGARGAGPGSSASTSAGRVNVPCMTLEEIIYMAYAGAGADPAERLTNDVVGQRLNVSRVRGGPDWVRSNRDRYTIEATAEGTSDRRMLLGPMLRALLESRFRLKLHRDQEDVDMYGLTIAKGGAKLQPLKEGDCSPVDRTKPMPPIDVNRPPCGAMNVSANGPDTVWNIIGAGVDLLALRLSPLLDRHVIDQTGLTDKFTIHLEFHPDENTPGLPPRADAIADPGTSLFAALEKQLGLKLEKTKGPRGFIVVDYIERPSPNPPSPSAPSSRGFGAAGR